MGTEIPNFYAVEGLDGVGKSTVVGELIKNGYTVLTTPPTEFKRFRPIFEHKDLRLRFLYYLLGVMYAGKLAQKIESRERTISDRYLLTTISAHEAMGLSQRWLSICMPIIKAVPIPENTFLITCEEQERLKRMYQRGANLVDQNNMAINPKILEGYFKWSNKLGHTLTTIDSTDISPQKVVEVINNLTKK